MFLLGFLDHRRDCRFKQTERLARLQALTTYKLPLKTEEREILSTPIGNLVDAIKSHTVQPCDVLRAYGKVALKAHTKTNCLTEVMIESAEAWIDDGSINMKGPLAGIPVSLKDTIIVGGYDTCLGYSSKVGNKAAKDGIVVRILKDAGAIPFVKTNIPITLLSFESTNDLWGRCTNPHNNKYSPGGSTGGESALLAVGGSRIGIGSDVAGSVRLPAASSGCYSLRCSTGRWPKGGIISSMSGQEGIPSVLSPMARTLDDLIYFSRAIMGMETWKYDHSVHPIPWREDVYHSTMQRPVYRVGVMRSDGVVDPSPACTRALDKTIAALRKDGHEIIEVEPPSPYEALVIASQLLLADNCATFESHRRSGEWLDRGVAMMKMMMALPRPLKWLYCAWVRHVRGDEIWAGLLDGWHHKTVAEQWSLVARREDYKARFHSWWQEEAKVDFLLAPVNAMPTLPHDAMQDAVSSCGYTFLFNLLDYSAGVIPVGHVDQAQDQLPKGFSINNLNGIAQGAYKHYDATTMHGLPLAVQIIGQRLEEEKVLAIMHRVEEMLGKDSYVLLEVD